MSLSRYCRLVPATVLLAGLCCATSAFGQSASGLGLDAPPTEQSAESLLGNVRDDAGAPPASVPHSGITPKPFGANLFQGGFSGDREDGLNPSYVIQPGDRIEVRIWGAIDFDESLVVDPRGNIFIPRVGPVEVGGSLNADLNTRVTQSVRTVYTDNVHVYTSLQGAQPVAVFVTGFVPFPGRFGGTPSNSALHFIDRAGGIDADKGSYRNIAVMRDGVSFAQIDLYDFLLDGVQPALQFQDGDTIVVGPRGGVITVSGDVANPAAFEIETSSILGAELLDTALSGDDVSHAGVSGIRDLKAFSRYLSIDEFAGFELRHGDMVNLRSDIREQEIVVSIEGAFVGPSRYALPRGTRLNDLLDHIEVDTELTNVGAISLRRVSIAERQSASLDESLRRLETQYLTAHSRTDEEARIRTQEAELIGDFVQRARNVEPSGRLVISSESKVANVLLESGDVISIPPRSESVLLSGEVLVAQAMLHRDGLRARDYIRTSGGFSAQAQTERLVVVRANGEVVTGNNPLVEAGDEVIVLPKVPVKNLQLAATLADILYKIAIATSVVIGL